MIKNWRSILFDKIFLKYCVVGVLGTLIDLGIFAALVEISHIDPKTSHLTYVFVTAGFVVAVINNFILNKIWTFGLAQKKNTKKQFIKFVITAVIGLLISNVLMYLWITVFLIWHIAAKLLTSAIVLVWNFFANKYWTFRIRVLQKGAKPVSHSIEYSIIIPAYNEAKRITATLQSVLSFLEKKSYSWEVIVVDDGSKDDTMAVVEEIAKGTSGLSVLRQHENRGKGAAVRAGVLAARGEYVLFTDADNSTPIEELNVFETLKKEADIIIGSRYLKDSRVEIKQPWYRIMISRASNLLIQAFLVDGIRDTQCGFKMFHYEAAQDIFGRMKVDGFGFDMEALALAEVIGYTIKEVPVSWYDAPNSRLRPVKDTLRTFGDLVYIKLNIWTGKYKA